MVHNKHLVPSNGKIRFTEATTPDYLRKVDNSAMTMELRPREEFREAFDWFMIGSLRPDIALCFR